MKVKLTEAQYKTLTENISVESVRQNVDNMINKVNGIYNILISSTLEELLNSEMIEKYMAELDNIDSICQNYEDKLNDILGDEWSKMPKNINLLYKKTYALNNMLYDIRRIVERNEEDEQSNLTNLFSDIQTKNIS